MSLYAARKLLLRLFNGSSGMHKAPPSQSKLLAVCLLLPAALPVVLLAALWLSIPWQNVWWLVCWVGVALCAVAAWCRRGWRAFFSLLAAGYVVAACLVLGLLLDEPSTPAGGFSLATGLAYLCGLLLLIGVVGLGGAVCRALWRNLAWNLRPRQLLGGVAVLSLSAALFGSMLAFGASFAGLKTNLQLVQQLANSDVQVFTPVRFAREVLATTYFWRGDPATPKLESFLGIPTSGYVGGSDAAETYIRAHAHPADKWSGANSYDRAIDVDTRETHGDGWGLLTAAAPIPMLSAAQGADRAPVPIPDEDKEVPSVDLGNGLRATGLISNVAPGSAAALAGVRRGDTIESVDGEAYLARLARLEGLWSSAASGQLRKDVKKEVKPAPAEKNLSKALVVRTQAGKAITLTQRKPYQTPGVQAVAWYSRGGTLVAPGLRSETLYVRSDRFTRQLGVYAEAEIRKSAQAAALEAAIRAVPDAPHWPTAVLRAGVQTLILDLRSNSGGQLYAVGDLANRLLGKYLQPGLELPAAQHQDDGAVAQTPSTWIEKPFTVIAANGNRIANANVRQAEQSGLLRSVQTVLILTSRDTCSASELLIYGLQKHLEGKVRVATIGDTTCGKPYGFTSRDYFGTSVWVVNSARLNALGLPAYPAGIEPTCKVKDYFFGPEGTVEDVVLEAAFSYVWKGRCD